MGSRYCEKTLTSVHENQNQNRKLNRSVLYVEKTCLFAEFKG